MNARAQPDQVATVAFTLNGKPATALEGETILQCAQRNGVDVPHLCYKDGLAPDGNCRACVVEIKGERVLAPSCCRAPAAGMQVQTNSARAEKSQRMVLELLLADMPQERHTTSSELDAWAARLAVQARPALKAIARQQPNADASHPAMLVNLDACIQCTRCIRACRDEQVNDVLGMALRGAHATVVFDMDDAMGESTCVGCGECVQACPTGALAPKQLTDARSTSAWMQPVDKQVDSVCPFCGVGCQLTYAVKDNRIVYVEGKDGPANHGRLCVKGRFGFDYAAHPQRLTKPLIRKAGAAKTAALLDPSRWQDVFREASWEEALDLAAGKLKHIRDTHGKRALAGFGSAKGSNEEAYLFQKLVRTGFGSNNVDHCTRLCHASSVAALLEGVGSAAVSNQVSDVQFAEVILLIGANPTSNHPVAATFIKNAVKRGAKLIIADPRKTDLSRHAWKHVQFKPDTDVALLNALLHVIVNDGLTDQRFIADRTSGYAELAQSVQAFSPEKMAPVCGIDAATLREIARTYASAKASMILWGMGISQHVHGTDNARCLIALALATGQIGRRGTGLHPLRGQNNVQGASDAGLIPMMLPDYRRTTDSAGHQFFEKLWNTQLDQTPGLTVVEVMHAAQRGEIKGMYIMGENPAMSDPDLNHARQALAALDWLVVQDIFLTETAGFADVVLPASAWPEKTGTVTNTDRMVQLGQRALDCPGDARQDLWIIQQMALRLGLHWNYRGEDSGVAQVYEEMRQAMPSITGITWERLAREHSLTYPNKDVHDPGASVEFMQRFPTSDGRGKFVPAQLISADEQPNVQYPMVLITGRQLEHWHTGAMTRRAHVLDAIESTPTASMHPQDIARLRIKHTAQVASRRGAITLAVRADDGVQPGSVFIPFCYHEAAANVLTNPALDPFGKIPEFKYCAVSIQPA
ncbi:MAG: formate dehydrogenase subunit alpha [Burkholderiaceae bacterium]